MKTGMKTGFFALIFLLSSTLQSFASLSPFMKIPPSGRDINTTAVTANVGHNLILDAERHITDNAAKNIYTQEEKHKNSSASVGVAASITLTSGVSYKPIASFSKDKSQSFSQQTIHSVSGFNVGNNVIITAGVENTSNEAKGQIGNITMEGTQINAGGDGFIKSTGHQTWNGVIDEYISSSSSKGFGISNSVADNIANRNNNYVAPSQGADMSTAALNIGGAGLGYLAKTSNIAGGFANLDPVKGGWNGARDAFFGGNSNGYDLSLSHSSSSSYSKEQVGKGAELNFGGNLVLEAGTDGNKKDINLIGTQISTGENLSLISSGDINILALETQNQYSNDGHNAGLSLDLSQLAADTLLKGGSIGGDDYNGSGTSYTRPNIDVGGTFSANGNDMNLEGAINAGNINIDLIGDLNIETVLDTYYGDGNSGSLSLGLDNIGGDIGFKDGNKAWANEDQIAGLFTDGMADIHVGGTTSLTGGAIVADELNLTTGDLEINDLEIYDESKDKEIAIGVNLNNFDKDDKNDSNSYGNVDYKNEGHDKEGEINSTIASNGGTITIGGKETSQEELEELGVNTDLDNLHIITKDEDWSIDLSVELLKPEVVAQQLEDSKNFIKAITTPVPDDVKASGPSQEDYYKRLTAQGFDNEEEIKEVLNTPEVQQFIKSKDNWNEAKEFYGGESKVPENIKTLIASGKTLDFSEGEPRIEIDCNQSISKGCYLTIDVRAQRERPDEIVSTAQKEIDKYIKRYNKTKDPKKKAIYAAIIEKNILYMELCSKVKGTGFSYAQAQGFEGDDATISRRIEAADSLADIRSPKGYSIGSLFGESNKYPNAGMELAYLALTDAVVNKDAGLNSSEEGYYFEQFFQHSMKKAAAYCTSLECLKTVVDYNNEISDTVVGLYEQGLVDKSFVDGGVNQFNERLKTRVIETAMAAPVAGASKYFAKFLPKKPVVKVPSSNAASNPQIVIDKKTGEVLGEMRYNIVNGQKVETFVPNKENFFKNTQYTDKVKDQRLLGDYHDFPDNVDAFAVQNGKVEVIIGGDGVARAKLTVEGNYRGKDGVFEYIRNPDGSINHRLFVPK